MNTARSIVGVAMVLGLLMQAEGALLLESNPLREATTQKRSKTFSGETHAKHEVPKASPLASQPKTVSPQQLKQPKAATRKARKEGATRPTLKTDSDAAKRLSVPVAPSIAGSAGTGPFSRPSTTERSKRSPLPSGRTGIASPPSLGAGRTAGGVHRSPGSPSQTPSFIGDASGTKGFGFPGAPSGRTPARGFGHGGRVPTPEMIEEVRRSRTHCADEPNMSFTVSPPSGEVYPGEFVELQWRVRRGDGGPWTEPVYLRSAPGRYRGTPPTAAFGPGEEVLADGPRAHRRFRAEELGDGAITYQLTTVCGSVELAVSLAPSPVIDEIEPLICARRISEIPDSESGLPPRRCPEVLRVRGHGFGSDSLPYRRLLLEMGGRQQELEIVSWSNIEIVAHLPGVLAAGLYPVTVVKGRSRGHSLQSRDAARVTWETWIDRALMEVVVVGTLSTARMRLDNIGPRRCDVPIWRPVDPFVRENYTDARGQRAVRLVARTLDDGTVVDYPYCERTHDAENCRLETTCTNYLADGSFVEFTDRLRRRQRTTFEIRTMVTTINVGVHRYRCRYFIDDVNSDSVTGNLRGAQVELGVTFESRGTEAKGLTVRGGDDWPCPDTELNNMELQLRFTLQLDGLGRIAYDPASVEVSFSGDFQAGGICDLPIDVCNSFGDYKDKIRDGTRNALTRELRSTAMQNRFADAISDALLEPLAVGRIVDFRVEPHTYVLVHVPR
jgi:hypothetical protein